MGCFSWKYCDSKGRMICGKYKNSYLLIPEEFGGGHLIESCYDGYGHIGIVAIYDAVADWNRKYLTTDMIEVPNRNLWGDTPEGQQWYERAMKKYQVQCNRLLDYVRGKSDAYMVKKYGNDWKREIGIDIACYDEDNKKLKYPIKIAEKEDSVYEQCRYSKRDPMQGCY